MSNLPPTNLPPPEQTIYRPASSMSAPLIVMIVLLLCSVPAIGILAGLLLPAIHQAREAARRMSCSSNVRQIEIALLNYESANKCLPPAYTVDSNGKKLHSWRTLILPYLEQQALYDSIDLTKPWDDPGNAAALETVVGIYSCPSLPIEKTQTTYKVVVDPTSAFPGDQSRKLSEITDGTSNTVFVFESDIYSAVHWMNPNDATMNDFLNNGKGSSKVIHFGGFHIGMGDGFLRFLPTDTQDKTKQAMVTVGGGENFGNFD